MLFGPAAIAVYLLQAKFVRRRLNLWLQQRPTIAPAFELARAVISIALVAALATLLPGPDGGPWAGGWAVLLGTAAGALLGFWLGVVALAVMVIGLVIGFMVLAGAISMAQNTSSARCLSLAPAPGMRVRVTGAMRG